ncbi:unnamed protein product [Polarella glacialis]|uniref:Uncharacterized protein n=1 Tax=Polarella glacialis TaxID=89957 RepID=A0A813HZN0_POLGL|nr:unnamed protein product [Polarella glacialis]
MSCCGGGGAPKSHASDGRMAAAAALEMTFPMYVMPLQTALELTETPPHQDLLQQGKLIEATDDMEIIFLSHPWVANGTPDPEFKQFSVFQGALKNLFIGMKIQICPGAAGMLPLFDADNRLTQNNKQHGLASAYLWYDYFGIPQIVERTEDQNVGAELQKAVDSIPAYIARCQHFFILAPPMMHVHRGYLVNTQAWSERGWCRTELACWALHGDRPCYNMVSPTLIFETTPSGWILCPPRFGNFAVEADRATVNKLIGIMIEHRVEFLRENMDEQFEFRLLNALQCHMATLRKAKTDLDAWLKDFCFQSPTEAAPPYGWTPIHLAAVQGNVAIIDALVERSADVNAKTTKKYKTLLYSSKGKTPLMLAALYISDEEHGSGRSVVGNLGCFGQDSEGFRGRAQRGGHLLNLLTRRLVRKGANPDDENKFGFSMTKNIAGVGNPELLKLCLERGGRHDASFKAKFPVSLLFSGMRLKKRMDNQFHYLTHLVARIEGSVPLHQAADKKINNNTQQQQQQVQQQEQKQQQQQKRTTNVACTRQQRWAT